MVGTFYRVYSIRRGDKMYLAENKEMELKRKYKLACTKPRANAFIDVKKNIDVSRPRAYLPYGS